MLRGTQAEHYIGEQRRKKEQEDRDFQRGPDFRLIKHLLEPQGDVDPTKGDDIGIDDLPGHRQHTTCKCLTDEEDRNG